LNDTFLGWGVRGGWETGGRLRIGSSDDSERCCGVDNWLGGTLLVPGKDPGILTLGVVGAVGETDSVGSSGVGETDSVGCSDVGETEAVGVADMVGGSVDNVSAF
jgi:hypothetical protein